jgi:hypothetical protein
MEAIRESATARTTVETFLSRAAAVGDRPFLATPFNSLFLLRVDTFVLAFWSAATLLYRMDVTAASA